VPPTSSRASIDIALDKVVGTQDSGLVEYSPSEVIDCSGDAIVPLPPGYAGPASSVASICPPGLNLATVRMMIGDYEARASAGLGGLKTLLSELAQSSERKIVLLLSAGMVQSDVAGGRPDFGDLGLAIGQEAARANATIYSIFIDRQYLEQYSAAARVEPRTSRNTGRDRNILTGWLGQAAGMSGGAFLPVIAGAEYAFDRVLSETSGYYVLGIAPEDADRDGRPRELKIEVRQRGATVRGRTWFVVPPKR
jgi:hypothetical protein